MKFKNNSNINEMLKKANTIKQKLNIPIPNTAVEILKDLKNQGILGLVVGGAVRDAILNKPSKDIDIEVYGVDLTTLINFLNKYGKAHLEGKSFGVVKLQDAAGNDYDFSIPRRDSLVENDPTSDSRGRGIQVELDSNMNPPEAAYRRDFTINSMAYNPLTEEIYDYYGGMADLNAGILRATSDSFSEDPLRVLRGMQFAGRFNMEVDPETAKLCKSIKNEPLQKDRVREEWMKFLTKSTVPSKGFQYLIDTEWIDNYLELKDMVGVPQEPEHHPEGSLDIHVGLTMDAAARISEEKKLDPTGKAVLIASALCHDLGKSTTTQEINGKITSYGHHKESARMAKNFLNSIGIKQDIIEVVIPLVEEHMSHIFFDPDSKKSTIMHLAGKLNNATIEQLEDVIKSDMAGRPPLSADLPEKAKLMISHAKERGVYVGKVPELISGKDLLSVSPTIVQSREIGDILRSVRQEQLKGNIETKNEALDYANKLLQKYFGLINGNDILNMIDGVGGPVVGQILQEAWQAQLSGKFNNKEDALNWLYSNIYNKRNEFSSAPDIDSLLESPK